MACLVPRLPPAGAFFELFLAGVAFERVGPREPLFGVAVALPFFEVGLAGLAFFLVWNVHL